MLTLAAGQCVPWHYYTEISDSFMPMTIAGNTVHGIGYSNDIAGGFAQYMPLAERLLLEVPNGLPAPHAALTEPMRWAGTRSRRRG